MKRRGLIVSLVGIVVVAVGGLVAHRRLGDQARCSASTSRAACRSCSSPDGQRRPATRLDQAVIDIIRNRIDALGVAEPEITRQGNTIVVKLPGVKDQDRALELVGQTAELQFRPVLAETLRARPPTPPTAGHDHGGDRSTTVGRRRPPPTPARPTTAAAPTDDGPRRRHRPTVPARRTTVAGPTATTSRPTTALPTASAAPASRRRRPGRRPTQDQVVLPRARRRRQRAAVYQLGPGLPDGQRPSRPAPARSSRTASGRSSLDLQGRRRRHRQVQRRRRAVLQPAHGADLPDRAAGHRPRRQGDLGAGASRPATLPDATVRSPISGKASTRARPRTWPWC